MFLDIIFMIAICLLYWMYWQLEDKLQMKTNHLMEAAMLLEARIKFIEKGKGKI